MNFRDFFITNTWWGKLLGAFFGYLTAGAAGAFFGLLAGNFFDRGLASYFTNPHWFYHNEKRKAVQKVFFESTFLVMGHIAKADGRVSEQEIKMAKLVMDEMRLDKQQKVFAQLLFNEGKQPTFKLDPVLTKLQTNCRDNRELLKLFVDIQYRASQIDGLTAKKIKMLDVIFAHLGFIPFHQQYRFYEDFAYSSTANEQQNNSQHSSSSYSHSSNERHNSNKQRSYQTNNNSLVQAYALIEVNPQASKQEVKRAYRRLISRNHPDKLMAQGLPPEMIKIANDKTSKIVKAYELICTNKGWK